MRLLRRDRARRAHRVEETFAPEVGGGHLHRRSTGETGRAELPQLPPRPGARLRPRRPGRPRRRGRAHARCASSASASSASPTSTSACSASILLSEGSLDARTRRSTRSTAGRRRAGRGRRRACRRRATTGIPLPDHIASRAYTTRLRSPRAPTATSSATLTQLLLEDARRPPRLAALAPRRDRVRGAGRPGRAADQDQGQGRGARTASTRSCSSPATTSSCSRAPPPGAMSVAIEPAQPSTRGPGVRAPGRDRHAARDRRLLRSRASRRRGLQARGGGEARARS